MNLHRTTKWLLNIAILIVAVVFMRGLVQRHTNNSDPVGMPAYLRPGAKFPLVDVDWSTRKQTVVLMLQSSCTYCTESAPFYRRIKHGLGQRTDVGVMALSSDSPTVAQNYLNQLEVSVDVLKSMSLRALEPYGLKGTPTIALVNSQGVVTGLWNGRLPPSKQSEILKKIEIKPDGMLDVIDEAELERLMKTVKKLTIVDLRSREESALGPLRNSRVIPIDELSVRAPDELSTSDLIVLYGPSDEWVCEKAHSILTDAGFNQIKVLRKDNVKMLSSSGSASATTPLTIPEQK